MVTGAQYIAEIMCERQFWIDPSNKGKDPKYKFWAEEHWAKQFKLQCVHMSRLAKLGITPPAISIVLKSPRGRTIYSLGNPILKDLALLEQKKIDSRKEVALNTPSPAPVDESLPTTRKPLRTKKSKFELLNEVRDGEESSSPTGEQG